MLPRLVFALIYLTVNALFVLKYGGRAVAHGPLLAALYVVAAPAAFRLLYRLPSRWFTGRAFAAIVIAFTVLMGIAFLIVPQESLRVDRYEMIRLFWDNAFGGINPYTPRGIDTNIPSPFPCYFLLALPFYLWKEIGLLSLAGFLLFAYMLARSEADVRTRIVAVLMLVGSPAFAWEIACRSTVFLNMVLVVGLIMLMERRSKQGFSDRASIGYGLLAGAVACTRSVALLVLVPYFLFLLYNRRAPRPVLYWTAVIGAFSVPFIPLLVFPSFYHGCNPFSVQSTLLPGPATAVVGLVSCAVALRLRSLSGFMLFQSLCLFLVVLAYAGMRIAACGWHAALAGDRADISYFLLVFPLLLAGFAGAASSRRSAAVNARPAPASLHA